MVITLDNYCHIVQENKLYISALTKFQMIAYFMSFSASSVAKTACHHSAAWVGGGWGSTLLLTIHRIHDGRNYHYISIRLSIITVIIMHRPWGVLFIWPVLFGL